MVSPIDVVVLALCAATALATAALWFSVLFAARLLRRPAAPAAALRAMTLIKPVKGLDEGLDQNFESLAACDPDARMQILIALESEADPAYPVARAFAARHPGRDVSVVLSGPPRGRMGKTHNMIEALKRAKHDCVVFSDADVQATPRLMSETSLAFDAGREAVFALPLHRRTRGLGGMLFEGAMNHAFVPAAALSWRVGVLRACAGAWMGFRRSALERAGGLEPIAYEIAEDFALSRRVAAARLDAALLPAAVPLRETGSTLAETIRHLAKWSCIIRWSIPRLYFAVPFATPGTLALGAWLLAEASGRHRPLAAGVAIAALLSRGAAAAVVDVTIGEGLAFPGRYAALAFMDLGALAFWLSGFRSQIWWRGVRYRLSHGGRAVVLP